MIGFFFLPRVFRSYIGSAEKGQEYREIHDQSGDITCMINIFSPGVQVY